MDFGDVTGLVALLLSAIAVGQGWRSDSNARKLFERLDKAHQREADRVDMLIKDLMNRSGGST